MATQPQRSGGQPAEASLPPAFLSRRCSFSQGLRGLSVLLSQKEVTSLPVVSGHFLWLVSTAAHLPLPSTHCVTLGMSPPLSWPLYLLQNGLNHPEPAGWLDFRSL